MTNVFKSNYNKEFNYKEIKIENWIPTEFTKLVTGREILVKSAFYSDNANSRFKYIFIERNWVSAFANRID